ncbi:MAG: hypothetical protein AAGH88_09325 [Planctomycetota bacterium]
MAFRIVNQGLEVTQTGRELSHAQGGGGAHLRAVVLLAGAVRANTLHKSTCRSSIKLPVGAGRTVLDCWREQLTTLAESQGLTLLPVRILVNQSSILEPGTERAGPLEITIEKDPSNLRGTGGLLSDIARHYEDEDYLFISNAGQLLFDPLSKVWHTLEKTGSDISLLTDRSGVPSGMMRLHCGTLREIKPVGFVDLNEQALPELAKSHDVRVVRSAATTAISVRTLQGYINALRMYYRQMSGRTMKNDPFAEDWHPTFAIIEPEAHVSNSAVIHDSVVMAGARVEGGAVVVRSVVCPGATVRRDQHVVDSCVALSPSS